MQWGHLCTVLYCTSQRARCGQAYGRTGQGRHGDERGFRAIPSRSQTRSKPASAGSRRAEKLIVVRLVVDDTDVPAEPPGSDGHPAAGPPPVDAPEEDIDPIEFARLPTEPDEPSSAAARLLKAFPGSEELNE